MKLEQGTVVSERYQILELIGVGGMSYVYRARDLKLERDVTFKVLKEEFSSDEEFIKRFSVEARAAAKLSHPNIVTVYDVGNDGNISYIVMEYIDGYTLKELITKKAPFENDEVLGVAIQICSALENAHKNNIVHRDIKPQNILVTRDGTIKVTDFGIARAASSATLTVESVGSVHYFSPEQARGVYVDSKSDIYSLGIVLFEMVTGRVPFDGDSAVSLAMKHMNDPIPDMRIFNPNVSDSIAKIVKKATEKVSSQRYQSAEEFNKDLKRALTNETGDFVKYNDIETDTSPTVIISKQDREEIRELGLANRSAGDAEYDYTNEKPLYTRNVEPAYEEYNNEEYEEYDKNTEKKVIIAAVITALAIIVLISVVGLFFMNGIIDTDVTAPDLKLKTWDDAVKEASALSVYVSRGEDEYSEEVEENLIISQTPAAENKIKKGDTIKVVISKGSEKFELEDVTGLEISEAYEKFADVSLEISEEYEFNDEVSLGVIIRQEPEGGQLVLPDSRLKLYISKGQEQTKVTVPNVKGRSEANAKVLLQSAGLKVGSIVYDSSETVEEGYVIKQGVNAGEQVGRDYVVNLVISTGAPEREETPVATETIQPESAITDSETNSDTNNEGESGEAQENTTQGNEVLSGNTKSETLTVNPVIEDGVDTVEVKVIKKTDSSTGEEVYSSTVGRDDFPLNITVSGSKPTEFQLYVNGQYEGSETKNFE